MRGCEPGSRLAKTIAKETHPVFNVAESFFLRPHLAFDTERAAITDLSQILNEPARVRLAATRRAPPLPASLHCRAVGVLDVDAADIGGEQLEHLERVVRLS